MYPRSLASEQQDTVGGVGKCTDIEYNKYLHGRCQHTMSDSQHKMLRCQHRFSFSRSRVRIIAPTLRRPCCFLCSPKVSLPVAYPRPAFAHPTELNIKCHNRNILCASSILCASIAYSFDDRARGMMFGHVARLSQSERSPTEPESVWGLCMRV